MQNSNILVLIKNFLGFVISQLGFQWDLTVYIFVDHIELAVVLLLYLYEKSLNL